jgi:hypothetical protein
LDFNSPLRGQGGVDKKEGENSKGRTGIFMKGKIRLFRKALNLSGTALRDGHL